jgi:hypothetical protein
LRRTSLDLAAAAVALQPPVAAKLSKEHQMVEKLPAINTTPSSTAACSTHMQQVALLKRSYTGFLSHLSLPLHKVSY